MISSPNAHLVGETDARHRLNTPALVLDGAAFERNLAAMAAIAAKRRMKLRPHAKTHKSVEIARRQVAAGAIGVCCTILREAEAMIAGGIPGIMLTSPVVTQSAITRLVALAETAPAGDLMVVVDNPHNAAALSEAFAGLERPLGVLVDFGALYNRTGTTTEAAAVALAEMLAALPHLELRGLQAYAGNIQHITDRAERGARAATLRDAVGRIVEEAARLGVDLPIVSGAGTGTHDLDEAPFTELQPGSYLFGDAQYGPVLANGVDEAAFETALFLQTAVISVNAAEYVTVDGGVKSLATDGPLPLVARGASSDCIYCFAGDEHGKILTPEGRRPALGQRIELVTPHCDPTVNLHDVIHVMDGDTLVAIWPIDARGH